jgi:probable blue pigment (indigoidine) exporter
VLGGGFVVGGYAAFLYAGEEGVGGGLAVILVATAPLWSALFGFLLLSGDRVGPKGAVGMVAGFVGVVVLFAPTGTVGAPGGWRDEAFVLAAAVVFSLGSVILRRTLTERTASWGLATEFAGATVLLGLLAIRPGSGEVLVLNQPVLLALTYLVAGPTILGYAIYFRLHHRIGPTRANLVAYVNPVAGLAVAVVLLAEGIGWNELAGLGLIITGLLLLQRERARSA